MEQHRPAQPAETDEGAHWPSEPSWPESTANPDEDTASLVAAEPISGPQPAWSPFTPVATQPSNDTDLALEDSGPHTPALRYLPQDQASPTNGPDEGLPPLVSTPPPATNSPVSPEEQRELPVDPPTQGTEFMNYPPPAQPPGDEPETPRPVPSAPQIQPWHNVPTGHQPPVDYQQSFPDEPGALERVGVTADDFARRRVVPPSGPIAAMGFRGALCKMSFGAVKLPPSRREKAVLRNVERVRRNFGGLRQVTVVNPKGGAGKTVAALMLAMTFGQRRGGYVLAWDNNETQGTLGMRAQQDFHIRTVRDLLRDLEHFQGPTGRVGDLSQYVRSQGEAMFDVLASDESATAGEMLTSRAFGELREAVSRFYKLIVVDTGNNVRAENWQSAIDATDQLVITMSARNDSAETAARALDHLEQTGRRDLVRRAVTVVSMPAHRKDVDLPAVQRHFAARTRAVMLAPYEKLLDSGEPIRYDLLSPASKRAWLRITAAVAEGL